jgi:excisionase family DNA binding protein
MAIEESWVGVEEVAAHLRVAKESVYRWVESKGLPAHRVGRLLRFKLSEVDEWVKNSGGDESSADSPAPASTSKVRTNRSRKKGAKKNRDE